MVQISYNSFLYKTIISIPGVGKTSIINRYLRNTYDKEHTTPTIGALTFTKKFDIREKEVEIIFHIWDTAGQERFKAIAPMYYRNSNAAIIVFDLSDYKSFTETQSWVRELYRNVQEPMVITLVGNKIDLVNERQVTIDEAVIYSSSIGASYFETSVKNEQGLNQVFMSICHGIIRLADDGRCRTIRQFDSCHSISKYAALDNDLTIQLSVPSGLPVANHVKTTANGRMEVPFSSIESIPFGIEEPSSFWCCI